MRSGRARVWLYLGLALLALLSRTAPASAQQSVSLRRHPHAIVSARDVKRLVRAGALTLPSPPLPFHQSRLRSGSSVSFNV